MRTRGKVLRKLSGYYRMLREGSTYTLTISGGILDTDEVVALDELADVKEVDIAYTSCMGLWE